MEQFGTTATYRALREGIRDYYRQWYPMRSEALALTDLNLGPAGSASSATSHVSPSPSWRA